MCSTFTTDSGYDNITNILIGDVYCPNTKCSGKFCLHKKLFNLSAEAIINVPNERLCFRCAMFLLEIKQIPFSCRLGNGFTFLKRVQNQFKLLLQMSIVLAKIVSTEKCDSFDGWVTLPRSIYGCGKRGVCLFVHKVLFMLQEHIKTTKLDKTRVFFAKKMKLVTNKPFLLDTPFQSTKYGKKDLCKDNKVQEAI